MPLDFKMATLCAIFLLAPVGCLTSTNPLADRPTTVKAPALSQELPTAPSPISGTEASLSGKPTPTLAPTPIPARGDTHTTMPSHEAILELQVTGISSANPDNGIQLRVYLPQEGLEETVKRVVMAFPGNGPIEDIIEFKRQKDAHYTGEAYVDPSLLKGRDLNWIQQHVGISVWNLSERPTCIGGMAPSKGCGVAKLYASVPGAAFWESYHWNDGIPRVITSTGDANDLLGWSRPRGIGTFAVDGQGVLTMSGSQPRFYVNGAPGKVWTNVEVTVYYRRVKDDGKWGGGLVIGARSGPDGHTGQSPCSATTYYGRLRHVGEADFYKELKHPLGEVKSRVDVWDGGPLPHDRWIGVKFVVYNSPVDGHVKLELYRDSTEGVNGGEWEKLVEHVDSGNWGNAEGCPYETDHIIAQGGGTVFIRNTGVEEAHYKWFTVREILAPGK